MNIHRVPSPLRATLPIPFVLLHATSLRAQEVRPIRDSIGFCWKADEMTSFVKYLTANADPVLEAPGNLVAAISVHDDYLNAGKVNRISSNTMTITPGRWRRASCSPSDRILSSP